MKLVVTIDVEEDNWGEFIPVGYSLENIKKIQGLQVMFDQYDIKPTYLVNYPVATDKFSIEMFKGFLAEGKCEIGMHCHPWNTPPFEEDNNAFNSMMSNLPEALQFKKLKVLKETIVNNLGVAPVSYRAGRWAFHEGSAKALAELDFKVDTSMMSYVNWSDYHGVDYGDVSPEPFRFNPGEIFKKDPDGILLQVPATVCYLQRDCSRANKLYKFLGGEVGKRLRLRGVLDVSRILNKVVLSPENSSSNNMNSLVDKMAANGFLVANMFFHSTTMKSGLSPFVKSADDEIIFMQRIENFLSYAAELGLESLTLSHFENSISRKLSTVQGAI